MKRKGIFTIFAAIFMVLAFSAMALAANQVFLKTTVPNIPKSTCYQAGTDTMEMDHNTSMVEGDVITFTLNNRVTICKDINMFVTLAPTNGVLDITGALPVSTTAGTITAAGTGQQWGFLVVGPVGSQIITLTLRQVTTATGALVAATGLRMTYTAPAPQFTDKMVTKLFDGKIGVFATSGIQKWTSAGVYNTAIVSTDNALCIDTLTQDYQGEYVVNTPNSVPGLSQDKLNFSGDYTIAHIMTAQTFSLVTCKGTVCGNIALGTTDQNGSYCTSFDYETNKTSGYCTSGPTSTLHQAASGYLPKFIIQSNQEFQPVVPYVVTATILVNGVAAERGVYWSATAPAYKTSDVTTCATDRAATTFGSVIYYKADGSTTVASPVNAGDNNCAAVTAAKKAIQFVTGAQAIFNAGQFFFELNLPPFVYNMAEVNTGDVVSVRVRLAKGTCGYVEFDLCIGTFGCQTTAPTSNTVSCIMPFVPSLASGDTYWTGIAISNNSAVAGTVDLTAYKKDGTTATVTGIAVPSKGMVSGFVYDTATFNWTGTRPTGVPAYIKASLTGIGVTTADLNAFTFMSDSISTVDATSNSMGYTCVK